MKDYIMIFIYRICIEYVYNMINKNKFFNEIKIPYYPIDKLKKYWYNILIG